MKNLMFVLVALVALIFVVAAPLRETVAEAETRTEHTPAPASTPAPAAAEAPSPVLVARTVTR
ncbi:MAG: hypothetical protein ABI574_07190 [Burkholderiales bacterium]